MFSDIETLTIQEIYDALSSQFPFVMTLDVDDPYNQIKFKYKDVDYGVKLATDVYGKRFIGLSGNRKDYSGFGLPCDSYDEFIRTLIRHTMYQPKEEDYTQLRLDI